jgi:hypothetical protein
MSLDEETTVSSNAAVVPVDYRIAAFSVPGDMESLEEILTGLPEMDRLTALQTARSLPGIIPGCVSREIAEEVVERLAAAGLKAIAVPASEIPDLLHVQRPHRINVSDDALETTDSRARIQGWSWQNVAVISVGVVPSTAPSGFRSLPLVASGSSHRSWNSSIKVSPRHRPEVWIVLRNGQPAICIASDEVSYEYLADRIAPSSAANFRLLVEDLIQHSPTAWLTPSTIAFREHRPASHFDFRTCDDFRRYIELQFVLSHQPEH